MNVTEFKTLRYKHTLALLNQAAAMGNEHAAGILSHLEKIDAEMQTLKASIEEIHMSREYFTKQDRILVELIALERKRRVILRAVKAHNLPTVLNFIIPDLNRRGEKNRKHLAS